MSDTKYIIGIDLGTTHCVVAYTAADVPENSEPEITLFEIPQVVSPGQVQAQPLLPSFLLLPGPHDVPEGGLALPWQHDMDSAVGEFARSRGAELPARLISSAKSWLCHRGVDRTQPILPWDAPTDARRVSPVEATTRYLSHIRAAWNAHMAADEPAARLENQEVYLTVPASFDAVARELTVQAANAAGLQRLTLLEEPQAAFYAWLEARGGRWREDITVGETILVCDVGGGTTDFSLIEVTEEEGNLALRRVAVGDHILLGGDNMDLTLAYAVRAKLAQDGTQLDNWQFRGLSHSCRQAKEKLLSNPELSAEPVVVLGRGSSLIGNTIRTELTRQEIESILSEGFFPQGEIGEHPQQRAAVGMREMGLPYAADPAITRHLAQFLSKQVSMDEAGADAATADVATADVGPADVATVDVGERIRFPSAVLFNGGVMKALPLRDRTMSAMQKWQPQSEIRDLISPDLDQSVALGAAYYGLVRKGLGIRIRAGTSRSYYIGIESAMPAVPGIPTPINALCVAPFGMEEGTEAQVSEREFGLVVGEPAVFQLLASTTRQGDVVGQKVEDWGGEIEEVAVMETQLPATDEEESGTILPVWLQSKVTEVGTLELWGISVQDNRQWRLEFNIREEAVPAGE